MTLPNLLLNPDLVIEQGTLSTGFDYAILHNGAGYRCGYIKVLPGHPWYRLHYYDLDVDVHGGLTYTQAGIGDQEIETNTWWLGFDCAHSGDAADPHLLPKDDFRLKYSYGTIKTTEYVKQQLIILGDQALAAAHNKPQVNSNLTITIDEIQQYLKRQPYITGRDLFRWICDREKD